MPNLAWIPVRRRVIRRITRIRTTLNATERRILSICNGVKIIGIGTEPYRNRKLHLFDNNQHCMSSTQNIRSRSILTYFVDLLKIPSTWRASQIYHLHIITLYKLENEWEQNPERDNRHLTSYIILWYSMSNRYRRTQKNVEHNL